MLRQRRSINERMVREGWALDYRKYSTQGRPQDAGGTIVGRSRAPHREGGDRSARACGRLFGLQGVSAIDSAFNSRPLILHGMSDLLDAFFCDPPAGA